MPASSPINNEPAVSTVDPECVKNALEWFETVVETDDDLRQLIIEKAPYLEGIKSLYEYTLKLGENSFHLRYTLGPILHNAHRTTQIIACFNSLKQLQVPVNRGYLYAISRRDNLSIEAAVQLFNEYQIPRISKFY